MTTILTRLDHWKQQAAISPEQHARLAGLVREEPFSVFLELNVLLYAGVLAFAAGLAWTVSTWSKQLGDVLVLAALSAMLATCVWYCASRAPVWSPRQTPSPTAIFDYTLYLGCLVWSVELAYLENRFHVVGRWDLWLLASAALFFFVAYRFDNRFVLSLALSSLAGWFGLTISHWSLYYGGIYRQSALLYCLIAGAAGIILYRCGLKPHFLGTYLNVLGNLLFWALLSGVFETQSRGQWLFPLFIACIASLAWGLKQRQFAFVAYAAVYGYIGLSSIVVRDIHEANAILSWFVVTGAAMVILLVLIARRYGRQA